MKVAGLNEASNHHVILRLNESNITSARVLAFALSSKCEQSNLFHYFNYEQLGGSTIFKVKYCDSLHSEVGTNWLDERRRENDFFVTNGCRSLRSNWCDFKLLVIQMFFGWVSWMSVKEYLSISVFEETENLSNLPDFPFTYVVHCGCRCKCIAFNSILVAQV